MGVILTGSDSDFPILASIVFDFTSIHKGTAMSNIDPQRHQFDHFKSLPRDNPIEMLNLIRLKAIASYPDEKTTTGAEAYRRYFVESAPIFQRGGGQIIWRGNPNCVVIGPSDEHWDIAFIARYPSAAEFLAMVTDPAYQSIVFHRQAAVADSRLIRCEEESSLGVGFS